jgi:GntR family transcriptional regulator
MAGMVGMDRINLTNEPSVRWEGSMANPMYRQIAEDLRGRIESGELPSGSQLPTELEFRERYNASRNTVRDAIKWLTALGLVATRPGQGTFVVEKIDPFVTKLSGNPKTGFGGGEGRSYLSEVSEGYRKPTTSRIRVEIQEAAPDIAEKLEKPTGSVVVSRHERRYIDGAPWSLQTSFYPMEFVERGAVRLTHPDDIEEGTVRYLAETLGLHQNGYRDWLVVRAPDPNETDFFRLAADGRTSIIQASRTAFDGDGQPMRVTITVYPADRNQLIFDFGQVPEQETGAET